MSDELRDSELRARFDVLKRIDAERAPVFTDVMARARAEVAATPATTRTEWSLLARRYAWLGGLAAAATIVALIALPRHESREAAAFERAVQAFHSDSALGAWRSPTDGLLDLPGSRLIATTPSISTIR
ncbi:MAG TPA: hypothetical protein VH559_14425 [Gemmatimonadaceae bacterium]|jgi:hypothetical protein